MLRNIVIMASSGLVLFSKDFNTSQVGQDGAGGSNGWRIRNSYGDDDGDDDDDDDVSCS